MIERVAVVLLLAVVVGAVALLLRSIARRRADRARGLVIPPDLLPDPARRGMSILYFFGTHCALCGQQAAVLDALETKAGTAVVRIDAARNGELARSMGVMTVPATAVLDRGHVRAVNLGPRSLQDLEAQLAG